MALEALIAQYGCPKPEILVICPDDVTASVASTFRQVRVLRDQGHGKPAALNLGLSAATGDIVVMTDGDVYVGPGALAALLEPFADPTVGAVSGRPISISPRNTMLGYWSHLLADAGAHEERLRRDRKGIFLVCSGYLYAIRQGIIPAIPEDALAEDAVISHMIAERGYQIRYAPAAAVFVKYPQTYQDWLKQKVRSGGGYVQPIIAASPLRMRSFRHEVVAGTWRALTYARTLREWCWTWLLFAARLHLWLLILLRVRLQRQRLAELWQRVESTK